MKFCMVLLGVIFLLQGYPYMVFNMTGSTCADTTICGTTSKNVLWSFANRLDSYSTNVMEDWLNLGILILMIILFQVWRRILRQTIVEMDEKVNSISDYAVMLTNLPMDFKGKNIRDEIKKWVNDQGDHYQVNTVLPCFSLTSFNRLKSQLDSANAGDTDNACLSFARPLLCCLPDLCPSLCKKKAPKVSQNALEELKKLKKCAEDGLDICQATGSKSAKFIGKAVVIFETQLMVAEFLDEFKLEDESHEFFVKFNLDCGKYEINTFDINPADKDFGPSNPDYIKPQKIWPIDINEPDDIIWENLSVSDLEFYHRMFWVLLMNFGAFSVVFFSLFKLNGINNTLSDSSASDDSITQALYMEAVGLGVSYGIVLVSMIQQAIMQWASQFSGYKTNTELAASIARSNAWFTFLNTAISPVITAFTYVNFFGTAGLVFTQTSILKAYAILAPISKILDFAWFKSEIQRFLLQQRETYKIRMSQDDLNNNIFTYPPFDIGAILGDKIVYVTSGCFFCFIIPLGTFWCFVGLFVNYWVEKYILVRRSSTSMYYSAEIIQMSTQSLEFAVVFYSLGLLLQWVIAVTILPSDLDPSFPEPLLLCIIISTVHYFAPTDRINEILFPIRGEEPDLTTSLNDAKKWTLENNKKLYESAHPILSFDPSQYDKVVQDAQNEEKKEP